jgi:glyoxylase-like metal-dependent hydrolase (beta-lactamase superfamily II)
MPLLLAFTTLFSGALLAGDDAVLAKLLHRYGTLPPAFEVEWRGEKIMFHQSPVPGPPWSITNFREHYWLDFEQGRYAMRHDEAGLGNHRERGYLLTGDTAWSLDFLAGTARPDIPAFGDRATSLARMLPALLVRLLAQYPQHWTAFSLGAIRYHTDEQSWWDIGYDPKTGRIRMLRRTGLDGNGNEVILRRVFENEIDIGGAWIPREMTEWVGSEQSRRWTLLRFGALEDNEEAFDLPHDFEKVARRPMDDINLQAELLAPGLHWVGSGGMRQLFVEFGSYIMALDACGGDTKARLNTIRQRVPGKPVRYVLVTHHHQDHLQGLEEHIRSGARVIASPAHREPIFTYLKKQGVDPDKVIFQWVSDRYQLTDGQRRIVVRDIQTPHSEHMLLAFLPEDRLAFVSDLWIANDDAPTVATPDMITLNAIIEVLEPLTRRIIDPHSSVVLETVNLKAAVERAEAKGLGLERTVGR